MDVADLIAGCIPLIAVNFRKAGDGEFGEA
jgi:hypothetical protein